MRSLDAADVFRAASDEVWRQEVEQMLEVYRRAFTDMTLTLDWTSSRANAMTWPRDSAGIAHIVLHGALARHSAMGLAALAIVVAHEVAHHVGIGQRFPDGLACERVADYHATRFVLSGVWGTAASQQATDGIRELATFWQVPILPAPPNTTRVTCDYPSHRCRVATLTAGAQLQPMPSCS